MHRKYWRLARQPARAARALLLVIALAGCGPWLRQRAGTAAPGGPGLEHWRRLLRRPGPDPRR
jgi:hypothetical protein